MNFYVIKFFLLKKSLTHNWLNRKSMPSLSTITIDHVPSLLLST